MDIERLEGLLGSTTPHITANHSTLCRTIPPYNDVAHGMIWCAMNGIVWCDMVWYGVVRWGMAQYGVVWCIVINYRVAENQGW